MEGKEESVGIRFLFGFFFLFLGFFIFWIHPSVSLEDGLEVRGTSDVLKSPFESEEVEFVKCPKDVWINVFSVNYRVIVGVMSVVMLT
jgi:hypothetical protein